MGIIIKDVMQKSELEYRYNTNQTNLLTLLKGSDTNGPSSLLSLALFDESLRNEDLFLRGNGTVQEDGISNSLKRARSRRVKELQRVPHSQTEGLCQNSTK